MPEKVSPSTRVTIGLLSGQNKVGQLKNFEPTHSLIELTCPAKTGSDEISEILVRLPPEDISYVAFHKTTDTGAKASDTNGMLREFRVHLPGKKLFVVTAESASIEHPLGFFAYPVSEHSWFERIFFYSHGINAVENQEPFGSLLVDSGLVSLEEVADGLREQEALQNSPLGQILVEQESVSSEAVDEAVSLQEESAAALGGAGQDGADTSDRRRLRLGEVLVEAGLASDEDIERALVEQRTRRDMRLGEVLIEMGVVTEHAVSRVLAKKFNLEFVDLNTYTIDPKAAEEVPLELIERFKLVPLKTTDTELTLAMSDPLEMEALDLLRFSLPKRVREVVATPSQIERVLQNWGEEKARDERANELERLLDELHVENDEQLGNGDSDITVDNSQDGAIVRMVNQIIIDAYRRDASDIHIEPNGPDRPVLIRFRIDGVCESYRELPAAHRAPLVARIKILSNLDITERRKPQDGKITMKVGSQKLELRVATVPTVNRDEDVVLRILAAGGAMPIDKLSLSEHNLRAIKKAVKVPYGLVLTVGPTGSGKTTTLHALLGSINTVERKIWTAEDPVEITQPGLRQVQMRPDIGLTFASALRSFLRADPDVIMVGEMRDHETAHIGIEASLTGHLVFSTLHTNSAPETITRLIDMGLDPFSFADALIAIVAQRLARRLCSSCSESYEASEEEYGEIAELYGEDRLEARLDGQPLVLWRASGCQRCDDKGYRGRVGIHELLVSDESLRQAIYQRKPVDDLRQVARETGMRTLIEDGIEKCLDGMTDLSQVLAVCSR